MISGMAADGFLTVPSKDGEKCDLYVVDSFNEPTFSKVDALEENGKTLDYFFMPTYYDNSGMEFLVNVCENKNDSELKRLSTRSEILIPSSMNLIKLFVLIVPSSLYSSSVNLTSNSSDGVGC